MLRHAKMAVLRIAELTGASRLLAASSWRRRRLLILCYHGVAMHDEHEWNPLYISLATFRRRMDLLTEAKCNVLPLGEAVTRLRQGTLPEAAVVITFDDGLHDFHRAALPVLESHGFPVTLYLTTYYVEYNRPVFDPMCSYLLWKGRDRKQLEWPEILASPVPLDEPGRGQAASRLKEYAIERKLSGREKDQLLAALSSRLGIDYEQLCRERVLQLVTPSEASDLGARGVDIQYHTHRHRMYRSRERMFAELEENRQRIARFTSAEPKHFCYTGGFYLPEHPGYLRDYGIVSATTCEQGLGAAGTNPMLLPRLVDTPGLSDLEFRAWLSGAADLLPQRPHRMSEGQLAD